MFSAIRKRLTPSTVIATLALILAMTGGAYAAGKYLITSTKQIKPSVLKQLTGKAGKAGPAGPAGAAGAAGAGTAGPAGPQGPAGPGGPGGAKGEAGPEGKEGKAGKEGKEGKEGKPWTAGGTLPKGSTETGLWSFGPAKTGQAALSAVFIASFPIPLAATAAITPHYINSSGEEVHFAEPPEPPTTTPPTGCGTPVGTIKEPKADPGNLCVYERETFHAESFSEGIVLVGVVGAQASFFVSEVGPENEPKGRGSWAVTAP